MEKTFDEEIQNSISAKFLGFQLNQIKEFIISWACNLFDKTIKSVDLSIK